MNPERFTYDPFYKYMCIHNNTYIDETQRPVIQTGSATVFFTDSYPLSLDIHNIPTGPKDGFYIPSTEYSGAIVVERPSNETLSQLLLTVFQKAAIHKHEIIILPSFAPLEASLVQQALHDVLKICNGVFQRIVLTKPSDS